MLESSLIKRKILNKNINNKPPTLPFNTNKKYYPKNINETIDYIRNLLNNYLKLTKQIDIINKDWIGINRDLEIIKHRAYEKFEPIQIFLEYIYFSLLDKYDLKKPIDEELEIYKTIKNEQNIESQILLTNEKSTELILSLSNYNILKLQHTLFHKLRHKKEINSNINNIAEEIADVELMLNQLKYIFSINLEVHNWKQCKLQKLKDILDKKR